MEVRVIAKDVGVSAQKMRPLVDLVRGKTVEEALTALRFAASPNARIVAKAVKSAAADAENNYELRSSDMKIVGIFADQAPSLKRYRARARRRVGRIRKRSSHITVIVGEQEG